MGASAYRHVEAVIEANGRQTIDVHARFITLLGNSGTQDIKIQIEDQTEEVLPAGVSIELADGERFFNFVRLINQTAAQITVQIAFSAGRIIDNRVTIANVLNVKDVADTIESPAKITATSTAGAVTIAADTDQRGIILENHSANIVWWGDANVDGSATRGTRLFPSKKEFIPTEAKLYLHAPAGNSDLTYVRLKRV